MEKGDVVVEENGVQDVAATTSLSSLDTLQFQHDFFEVLGELQLRRQEDEEHKVKVQELLKNKYELETRLEAAQLANGQLEEKHKAEQDDIQHNYEEKIRSLQEEKAKAVANASCDDVQVGRLKNEIRALHLHKYNLEKTINDQEHKMQLQSSSHEQFLLLVRQLEEKCATLSKQVVDVNEQLDLLSNNVQEAVTVNDKLEKQQRHHQCVVLSYQDELASTKKELLRVTTELSISNKTTTTSNGDITHTKNLDHQLKIQQEMNALVEKQLEDLQQENASITSALKESHNLLDRQCDGYEQTKSDNTRLSDQLSYALEHGKAVSDELAKKNSDMIELDKRLQLEQEESSNKLLDMEQRLRSLQGDFLALQQSYDTLQGEKKQWVKDRNEHASLLATKEERIVTLEQQLNKTSPPHDNDTFQSIESSQRNKRSNEVVADVSPADKKICLSPLVSPAADGPALSTSVHDSPDKPLSSSSHDCSAMLPSSVHDLPTNATATINAINNICLSPVTTSHPSIVQESPAVEPSSCDPPDIPSCSSHTSATPPQSAKTLHQDKAPISPATPPLSEHTPPLLTTNSHDQLHFNDPDIINTQLNYQISEVKNFLKADNLKLTKLKPMTTHNTNTSI